VKKLPERPIWLSSGDRPVSDRPPIEVPASVRTDGERANAAGVEVSGGDSEGAAVVPGGPSPAPAPQPSPQPEAPNLEGAVVLPEPPAADPEPVAEPEPAAEPAADPQTPLAPGESSRPPRNLGIRDSDDGR